MNILLFVSTNCPACPKAERMVKKVVPDYFKEGADFEKIRTKTSKGKELSSKYKIRGTPTIIITKENEEVGRFVGTPSESKLRNEIEKALGLKKSFLDKIFKVG